MSILLFCLGWEKEQLFNMLVEKEGDVDKTRESGEISHAKELSNKRN